MLAEILKEKRHALKLTQQEVADELNVTRQTVSSWEVGKSIPDIYSLIHLSELYDISLDYMLKGDTQVSEKLKKDTIELKFLRFFSKSTLIIMCVALMLMIPFSAIILLGIFVYLTIIKKKKVKIMTHTKEEKVMGKRTSNAIKSIIDSTSIIGAVSLFYVVISIILGNDSLIVDEQNRYMIIVLFVGMAMGRYIRYKRDS